MQAYPRMKWLIQIIERLLYKFYKHAHYKKALKTGKLSALNKPARWYNLPLKSPFLIHSKVSVKAWPKECVEHPHNYIVRKVFWIIQKQEPIPTSRAIEILIYQTSFCCKQLSNLCLFYTGDMVYKAGSRIIRVNFISGKNNKAVILMLSEANGIGYFHRK